jgi:hypothetical protein
MITTVFQGRIERIVGKVVIVTLKNPPKKELVAHISRKKLESAGIKISEWAQFIYTVTVDSEGNKSSKFEYVPPKEVETAEESAKLWKKLEEELC